VWSTPFIFIKMRVAWELHLGVCAAIENAVEEDEMKSKLFALMLLAGSALMAGPRFFVGVGFGGYYGGYVAPAPVYYAPPPVAPVASYVPVAPGPGYTWVGGYWYPYAGRYSWHAGYWARPAYAGARWVGPRYAGHYYYGGYWRR
jgi:hypothetical protein